MKPEQINWPTSTPRASSGRQFSHPIFAPQADARLGEMFESARTPETRSSPAIAKAATDPAERAWSHPRSDAFTGLEFDVHERVDDILQETSIDHGGHGLRRVGRDVVVEAIV